MGFSAGTGWYTSLAFDSSGQPFVAFQDAGNSWKATVMKFDGANCVNVGTAGFSAGVVFYTNIAFSPSGEPHVAYKDGNYGKATVMKFDGTNWVNVGNAGFSAGEVDCTSLGFNPIDSLPYVSFLDYTPDGKADCMKFDGANWVNVGNVGFSPGVWYTSLALSPSGHPYVAYTDYADSNKATVMKYDSVYMDIKKLIRPGLSIYPNPATDKITIERSTTPVKSQLTMMNLNGEEVLTRNLIKPKTQIDISNLPSGVYFVRVTNDKTVEVGKFIKK